MSHYAIQGVWYKGGLLGKGIGKEEGQMDKMDRMDRSRAMRAQKEGQRKMERGTETGGENEKEVEEGARERWLFLCIPPLAYLVMVAVIDDINHY